MELRSIPIPPSVIGAFTYFGRYERKVYKDQLLQNVATAIATNGIFLINLKKGIEGADSFDGASFLINFNSCAERFLLSSGNEVTLLFQKKYQKIPTIPKR